MNPSQQLTLFTEDSLDHANHSPWLVTGKDGTTLDSCGLSFRGWSEKLARVGWLLRTFLESLPLPPMTSARIWSVSVTASGFGILKLYLSGRRTGGHGCSLLPTPRGATGMAYPLREPKNVRDTSRLEDFVAFYPTPRCCNGKRSSGANRSEFYRIWATPKAGQPHEPLGVLWRRRRTSRHRCTFTPPPRYAGITTERESPKLRRTVWRHSYRNCFRPRPPTMRRTTERHPSRTGTLRC